jgi:putative ABC transport system permease protein
MKNSPTPPRWADRLLEWWLSDQLLEEVQGDLHERFYKRVSVWGEKEARKQYVWDALGYLKPRAGRFFAFQRDKQTDYSSNSFLMLQSYFITALRSLRRNLSYTVLNVSGLALGMAACLILFLVVRNELGFDKFHRKADRTYRVTLNALDYNSNVSLAVVSALRTDFPELERITQVFYQRDGLVKVGANRYNEKAFAFADAEFTGVFDYQWLAGDPKTALIEPNSIVLTESMAKKYFGEQPAIGQVIRLNNQYDLKVTGLIEDVPPNTHLPFQFLVSWSTVEKDYVNGCRNFWCIPGGSYVYMVIPPHYDIQQMEKKIPAFLTKNWGKDIAREAKLPLQPMLDIHFDQRYINNILTPTSRQTYWALAGIAVFIIVTACINFVNLATAQAFKRAKEVGVRKVLGAYRGQLIRQFMSETILLVLLALCIGLVATNMLLPSAEQWLNIRIDAGQLTEPAVIAVIAGITLTVMLLAGLYPAFVQSAFRPVETLKSQFTSSAFQGLTLRKSLVVVQFVISQVLIVGTLVVANQMDYFMNQDLGYNKEAVVAFGLPDKSKRDVLEEALRNNPGVTGMSFSSGAPPYNNNATSFSSKELGLLKDDVTEVKFVDDRYLDLFELKLLAGEKIRKTNTNDSLMDVVVNETLIHKLGIQEPQEALGKHILLNGDRYSTITGVVQDFQSESKHKKRRSCVLTYMPDAFFAASVKISPQNRRATIAQIDKAWSALFPENVFEYEFLDEHIANMYQQEQKVYTAFRLFSGIAIFIGCLGLYGLVAFMAVQRTKEVGIRKVLGASVTNIVTLFSGEFLKLVVLANVIAWPLAWYAMNQWLENFAYRIELDAWVFVIAGLSAILITILTISYQAIKAAIANPIKSLRTE